MSTDNNKLLKIDINLDLMYCISFLLCYYLKMTKNIKQQENF